MSLGQEIPAVLIPKYSMIGPFKGHRSMKSTPLFPGSSCSLSTQFLLQDHMAAHYRNLYCAKASVDTSPPKSLSRSVKYKDQQNKEKLLRAIDKFKKELQQIHPTAHHRAKSNFLEQGKVHQGHRDIQMSLMSPFLGLWREPSPDLTLEDFLYRNGMGTNYYSNVATSRSQIFLQKKPYKDPEKQTYGGDLLDKHTASFTNVEKAFKPRLLKKSASSFLSKYRYYKAPAKNNNRTDRDHLSSLDRFLEASYKPLENITHASKSMAEAHETHSKLLKQEDDLKCLNFLKELTDDILLRGGGSSTVIDRVFQDHIKRKEHNIPEVTKRILMQELKEELQKPEKLDFSISYTGILYGSGNFPLQGTLAYLLT